MSAPSFSASKPVWFGVLLGLAGIVLFLGITVVFRMNSGGGSREEQERARIRVKNLAELREQNTKVLNEYEWVNKEQGRVRIPIQQAMELEITALNQKKPAPAYPIATPAPAAPVEAAPAQALPATPTPAENAPASPAESSPAAPQANP